MEALDGYNCLARGLRYCDEILDRTS